MEKVQHRQQGTGYERKYAEMHGVGQVARRFLQQGSHLGTKPPVDGHRRFPLHGRDEFGPFQAGPPHLALHPPPEGQLERIGRGDHIHEIIAHDAGPVESSGFDDAGFHEGVGACFFLKTAVAVPRQPRRVVRAFSKRRGGHDKTEPRGPRRGVRRSDKQVLADEVGVGMKGERARHAHAVHHADERQALCFPRRKGEIAPVKGPGSDAPGGLAVDRHPHRRGQRRIGGNQVDQGRVGLKIAFVVLEREGAQNAAPRIDHGGVQRRFHLHFPARSRSEHRRGRRRSGGNNRLGRGRGGGRGLLPRFLRARLNPAHVFGQMRPADKDDDG